MEPLFKMTGSEQRAKVAVFFFAIKTGMMDTFEKRIYVLNTGQYCTDMESQGCTYEMCVAIKEKVLEMQSALKGAFFEDLCHGPTDEVLDAISGKEEKPQAKMVTCGVCGFVCDQRNIARHRKSSTCVPGKQPTKEEKAALAKARQNEKTMCELCGFVTMARNLPRHQEGSRCKKRAKAKAEEEAKDACVECEIESEE
jgi:hypothetical protein